MPFIPVLNTVLIELRMLLNNQRVENTLYLQNSTAWGPGDLLGTANALVLWWTTDYSKCLSQDVLLREVAVTDLTTATSSAAVGTAPSPLPTGDVLEAASPNNVSLCVSFRTAGRGRSSRGRNYVTGIPVGHIIGSSVNSAYRTLVIDAYQSFKTLAESIDVQWVVVSRFSGVDGDGKPIPRLAGETHPITSINVVDLTVDSQRRRLPGRGL